MVFINTKEVGPLWAEKTKKWSMSDAVPLIEEPRMSWIKGYYIYYPPEVKRGKYWGLGVFLLQYFSLVKL